MDIIYLKKLEENLKIGIRKIEGVSEAEILAVEEKFDIQFPKAYREFLFLAGAYCGALPLYDTASLKELAADWHQEILKETMEDFGTVIDKPFWLYAESNGCEQFGFFYLNDGDDPIVYSVDYDDYNNEKQSITKSDLTFSQMIDNAIDKGYDNIHQRIW